MQYMQTMTGEEVAAKLGGATTTWPADWQDVESTRGRTVPSTELSLRVDKAGRDAILSVAAAEWLRERVGRQTTDLQGGEFTVRVRIQWSTVTGDVWLLPSTDADAIAVRRGAKSNNPLGRRFYIIRLARLGLVKGQQVVRLRPSNDQHPDRLLLAGVKRPLK